MNPKALLSALLLSTLTACSALGQTPQPLPTVVLGDVRTSQPPEQTTRQPASPAASGGVVASGVVVAAQEVRLAFSLSERVKAVNVAVGDEVKAGQVLATLDDALLQAQIQQAGAAVAAAQASYDLLAGGPASELLRQAEAAVVIATANYSRTVAGARPASIAAARAALAAAVDAYNRVKAGPQPLDVAATEALLKNAQAALQQAQYAYDRAFAADPAGIGASPAALALQQATNNYHAAQAAYDKAAQQPEAAQLSAALQQVQSARAALDAALSPARDFDVAQSKAQIKQAQAQLDALKAGPRVQQLDAARAQVDAARAARAVLEAQQTRYSLVAPSDGVVLSRAVQPGETAMPGAPALVLADLTRLRVETTDLSERDVPRVSKGQPVTVLIKALDQQVAGHVLDISPTASTLGGDVVYKTTIELDNRPAPLRSGMSVEVRFAAP